MGLISFLLEIMRKPSIGDMLAESMVFIAPLWIAVSVGVLVGWAWKPKWANSTKQMLDCWSSKNVFRDSEPFTFCSSIPSFNSFKFQFTNYISWIADDGARKESVSETLDGNTSTDFSSQLEREKSGMVADGDLEHLCRLVEVKDGGPAWIQMMDRSTPTMGYRAWRRDPENGPAQYRTSTIFEDATPELVRDFFWDDESRLKWDDMLIHASILEECPTTGTMMVRWVRKFPFFCSDREYMIGRRMWESGRLYYCVTKGVPCPSMPRLNKPRRVDMYYSSWCIRAVESRRGDGQLTACEVLLFHQEDMGIPWELAKIGVRQGMWGAVKKIDPGLREYQKQRATGASLSRCAFMAQINTKVSADYLRYLEGNGSNSSEVEKSETSDKPAVGRNNNMPRLLLMGGVVAVACSLDRGLMTKAVIFGVARRFGNILGKNDKM